jgi:hypothetical protein
MEKQKVYCGSGKKKSENWISASINIDKIQEHIQEYNGTKFVRLNINIGKPDQYGKDVSISVDTWKPEQKSESKKPEYQSAEEFDNELDGGLPF